uniref:DUF659 domain-containing protein n=1 Tax=Nelumbo nucifera TaxID=4432 RepID=A0A822YC59_NELNU|nr:TPA_asm: hypothetical protein HUJ06_031505 [Nelumbo nucifera]
MDSFVRPSPEEVVEVRHKGQLVQTSIEINEYVAKWFYQARIPFNTVKLKSFKVMVEAIEQFGFGYKPPSYHELRKPLLKEEVEKTKQMHKEYEASWKTYGCTIMFDGWTDKKQRSLIIFLVNSFEGTFFSKIIVKEIEEEHVVQVVTDNHFAYVVVGDFLRFKRKNLLWTPCAARFLDLMLENIGKLRSTKSCIARARQVTAFIYWHPLLLTHMKEKTNGRDLV